MIPQTGTVFLNDLYRRAFSDGRMHLVETTVIAAIAGGLGRVRVDEWGVVKLGSVSEGLLTALLTAALWLAVGLLLQRLAREFCRAYIANLLISSGLLYLLLEHDPHEALKPLTRRETWTRLKLSPNVGLNFRGRMLAFLRTYPTCVNALGFHPYPAAFRWISRGLDYLLLALAGVFAWQVYANILNAMAYGLVLSPAVRIIAWIVLLLVLVRATLNVARRSGLWLALTDVLQGDVDRGRAVLARG